MTRIARRAAVTLALVVVAACSGFAAAGGAAPAWAPAASARIHPGVQTVTAGSQCTANFVFTEGAGVYLGQAAHCASPGVDGGADGCTARSLPLGTPVRIQGATRPGVLAYSSWLTMAAKGEDDPDACVYNDFALVLVHPADVGRVNPSVPHWGGPVGVSAGAPPGDRVFSYGNSGLRLGLGLLSPKVGLTLGTTGSGWSRTVYTVTPGIPGDSGSAYLDGRGNALGVLSTMEIAPLPASNGVTDLRRALLYLRAATGADVKVAAGTEPFNPNRLPLGL